MRPYADQNEARIDRDEEREQEAYDAAHDAAVEEQRANWLADGLTRSFMPDYQAAHEWATAELARRKSTEGE